MNLAQIRKEIFDNLNLLSSENDTSIREGRVTLPAVNRNINYLYREVLFNQLSDKFPEDFERQTYPFATYTQTGTATTVGTALTATTAIFDNTLEGFKIQNPTTNESIEIATYVSPTQVTLKTAPSVNWSSATIYVLGNEYSFGGDAEDIKIIKELEVKYTATDNYFKIATFADKKDLITNGDEWFSQTQPYYYKTTLHSLDDNSVAQPKSAFGILPYPTSYQGKLRITYIELPPQLLVDTDTPTLSVPGIGQCIVNGVTAWGYRKMKDFEVADRYERLHLMQLDNIVRRYRPKKYRKSKIEESTHFSAIKLGII